MGAKLKPLSGRELISIFERFGFSAISQHGSHVKMRRFSIAGTETLTIPRPHSHPEGHAARDLRPRCAFCAP